VINDVRMIEPYITSMNVYIGSIGSLDLKTVIID